MEYNESYKTKSVGAYTESLHKFVKGTNIIERAKEKEVRVLDICFGVGLNLAVTIDEALKHNITNRIHAVSVEKDSSLINIVKNTHILMPVNGYKLLRNLLNNNIYNNFSLELYIQDAVDFIYSLNHKFDIIYFDPFSKKHNSEMWSDNMFHKLYSLLDKGGVLTTYASSKSIKESLANAGFSISSLVSLGSRYQPATKAVKL
ncbi:MAG: MnmC family methyltransferase [Candidatus Mucispirillum faecigallinarum]|uniref:MnmC-like methyltransferase domain-containing protein n=1 Tax=Candidatus Mucispirillum faecigallinarum TaxID=2838699 RepID=A0A9D2GSV5_9BACT|nr:MnmC family methyltransferase [Mucispirillum sp.]MDY5050874.1 MnmC family methyltransferase [Candidatus Mucispirillum faecigallinarum]HIZ88376.1 hypothetical protein [Candidatus Mucispirillum faecigallinarum]